MPYNKFTDEQIIKVLKCIEDEDRILCAECAFANVETAFRCKKFAAKAAIDLIKRQREEIAMLTKEKDNLIRTYKECMVSAIREFAERLLDKYDIWSDSDVTEYQYVAELVNNLVKEMTEDKS